MDRFLVSVEMGAGIAIGFSVTMFFAGVAIGLIRRQQKNWAQKVIAEYKRTHQEQMQQYVFGLEEPKEGMIVQAGQQVYNLPPFYVDLELTEEENRERLMAHLEEYASDMPDDAKDYMVEELVKHAFPMAMQMQFQKDLEDLRPDDFREED